MKRLIAFTLMLFVRSAQAAADAQSFIRLKLSPGRRVEEAQRQPLGCRGTVPLRFTASPDRGNR